MTVFIIVRFKQFHKQTIGNKDTWNQTFLSHVYTIQPVVKPVVKPDWQPVVSCIQTFNRLSKPFNNRFETG